MLKAEIEKIAVSFNKGTPLPIRPELDWCRNPITGEYAERLLNLFEMADMLRKRGFFVEVRHGFRRKPLHFLNGIQFKPLNILLFNVRPVFILVADRF